MGGDFFARIDELAQRVGDGELVGRVEVDQVYAQYQHEGLDLHHPRGGQALFLATPLQERHGEYLQRVADHLHAEGPQRPMEDVVEDMAGQVAQLAPVEFEDLRRSAHPTVEDNGTPVYDRAPEVGRLSEEQLREKDSARSTRTSARSTRR